MKTFDPKKLRKLTINVQEMSRNLIFSRNFTISNPKDRVNYVLLGGGQISERGAIFTRKYAPPGPNFLGNLARGGQIFCDTGYKSFKDIQRTCYIKNRGLPES